MLCQFCSGPMNHLSTDIDDYNPLDVTILSECPGCGALHTDQAGQASHWDAPYQVRAVYGPAKPPMVATYVCSCGQIWWTDGGRTLRGSLRWMDAYRRSPILGWGATPHCWCAEELPVLSALRRAA